MAEDPSFTSFLQKLTNLEKTRFFNAFQNYTLTKLEEVLDYFKLNRDEINREKLIRISVVGTNGKGSTSHFISQLALMSGKFKNVGLYTSPHLESYLERIQINSEFISENWLDNKLKNLSRQEKSLIGELSYFELLTLMSILFFHESKCDIEVYEAGLGGRLDATKLVSSDYVVLTNVGLDHTEILGSSREKILIEKLNIISDYTKHIIHTIDKTDPIFPVLEKFCKNNRVEPSYYRLVNSRDYLDNNKKLAYFAFNKILKMEKIPESRNKTYSENLIPPPGRIETLREDASVIFDIGHNPAGIKMFLHSVSLRYPQKDWVFYFACLKDKDGRAMLEEALQYKKIKEIKLVLGPDFQKEIPGFYNLQNIQLSDLVTVLQNEKENILIAGTFRLYEYAKKAFP